MELLPYWLYIIFPISIFIIYYYIPDFSIREHLNKYYASIQQHFKKKEVYNNGIYC